MQPNDYPRLIDALFRLKDKHGITPPTPLIVAMDGAGKNALHDAYTADRKIGNATVKLGQAESAGDLLGVMARIDLLACPGCIAKDAANGDRYTEADLVVHAQEAHGISPEALRPALEPLRLLTRSASRFLPPAYLPTHGRGVFCMDEYNRANGMVENLSLELIREQRLSMNGWQLPKEWIMVAFANPPTERFTGANPLDAASESRVIILNLTPTSKDFVAYARRAGLHDSVVRFVESAPTCLDGMQFENPMLASVKPNPRRLQMLGEMALVLAPDDPLLLECAEGLVGPDFAEQYISVLKQGVLPFEADAILKQYAKHKAAVAQHIKDGRLDVIDGTVSNILHQLGETGKDLPKKELGNLCKFVCDLPPESLVRFLTGCRDADKDSGPRKAYVGLRDGYEAFTERALAVMDQGIDLLPPAEAAVEA